MTTRADRYSLHIYTESGQDIPQDIQRYMRDDINGTLPTGAGNDPPTAPAPPRPDAYAEQVTTNLTNEERKRLCEWLRDHGDGPLIWQAADEIERLMGEVQNWELWAKSQSSYQDQEAAIAQSDAEPPRISEISAGSPYCLTEFPDEPTHAQSDAEPVALNPVFWEACECLAEWADMPNFTKYAFPIYKRTLGVLPRLKTVLDAALPRPDASAETTRPDASAGLIEAAEWHETADKQLRKEADILYTESRFEEARTFEIQATNHRNSAKHLRARAADRSRK